MLFIEKDEMNRNKEMLKCEDNLVKCNFNCLNKSTYIEALTVNIQTLSHRFYLYTFSYAVLKNHK